MSDGQELRSERTFEKQIAADLAWHRREVDPGENEETTPPADERIETCRTWVAECYPPSHAAALVSGLKKLGWAKPRPTDLYGDEVVAWLEQQRGHPYGGAWLHLGHIVRQGEGKRFLGSEPRIAELPEGVDYAYGYVRNLLPSLTVLIIQFLLDDQSAR